MAEPVRDDPDVNSSTQPVCCARMTKVVGPPRLCSGMYGCLPFLVPRCVASLSFGKDSSGSELMAFQSENHHYCLRGGFKVFIRILISFTFAAHVLE
jgi:hypothetical protein